MFGIGVIVTLVFIGCGVVGYVYAKKRPAGK